MKIEHLPGNLTIYTESVEERDERIKKALEESQVTITPGQIAWLKRSRGH